MLDILIGIVLFAGGLALGWFGRQAVLKAQHTEPEQLPETEIDKLKAEQAAFEQLMGYNLNTAYGLDKKES